MDAQEEAAARPAPRPLVSPAGSVPPSPMMRSLPLGGGRSPAEKLLRSVAPSCSAAVRERLRRENVVSEMDLAGLDKEDLRELGLSMVERSKVLQWARQLDAAEQRRRMSSAGASEQQDDGGDFRETSEDMEPSGGPPSLCAADSGVQQFQSLSGLSHAALLARVNSGDCAGFDDDSDSTLRAHLDGVESKWEFWSRIVREDTGVDALRRQVEKAEDMLDKARRKQAGESGDSYSFRNMREDLLEKFFDLSHERLKELYEGSAQGPLGLFSKEALREALQSCELLGFDDGTLDKLLHEVSVDGSGHIQLPEFESLLTRLKLAQLLSGSRYQNRRLNDISARPRGDDRQPRRDVPVVTILEYSNKESRECSPWAIDFFFGHRVAEFPMRWVHLSSCDLTVLLALMVKYQLHPLSVEDTIDQSPTRYDKYGVHSFVAVEYLCLADGLDDGLEPVQVFGRHLTIFCAGPPHLDTVITVAQADRTFEQDWPGDQPTGSEPTGMERLNDLRRRVHAPRSRTRERRADFLTYQIIDCCVDELIRVCRAYHLRLNWLEEWLDKKWLKPSDGAGEPRGAVESRQEAWGMEVRQVRTQLGIVARRLRGLQRVLRRLGDDADMSGALADYWRDVADHLNEAYDDTLANVDKSKSLLQSFEQFKDSEQDRDSREQDERMNRILFVLTIVTTVFTPITFLAGVYGMNFGDEDGRPTIPELLWPQGYLIFWIFIIVYFFLSVFVSLWLWRGYATKRQPQQQPPQPSQQLSTRQQWALSRSSYTCLEHDGVDG